MAIFNSHAMHSPLDRETHMTTAIHKIGNSVNLLVCNQYFRYFNLYEKVLLPFLELNVFIWSFNLAFNYKGGELDHIPVQIKDYSFITSFGFTRRKRSHSWFSDLSSHSGTLCLLSDQERSFSEICPKLVRTTF